MGVAVQRENRPVGLQRALQTGAAEERKDWFGFAHDGFFDGRVVGDGDFLFRLCLSQAIVELDSFTFGDLDEGLDSLLSKRHEFIGREATAKALGSGKADTIDLVALTVEQVDSGETEHAGKLVLVSTFVVVVPEHRNDGNAYAIEHTEDGAHLFGHAVIGEVAGDNQYVSKIIDRGELSAHRARDFRQ